MTQGSTPKPTTPATTPTPPTATVDALTHPTSTQAVAERHDSIMDTVNDLKVSLIGTVVGGKDVVLSKVNDVTPTTEGVKQAARSRTGLTTMGTALLAAIALVIRRRRARAQRFASITRRFRAL